MNTSQKMKYFPTFMILLGIVNVLVEISVAVIRILLKVVITEHFVTLYQSLSIIEPYVKMALETGIVLLFVVIIIRGKNDLDRVMIVIWGFVTIGVQILYYISSYYYGMLVNEMMSDLSPYEYGTFYASTHVFKYAPMFIGLIMGIIITGAVLRDKWLVLICLILSSGYIACYGMEDMIPVVLPNGSQLGLVIPALIFHITESVGILLMGLYCKKKYTLHKGETICSRP